MTTTTDNLSDAIRDALGPARWGRGGRTAAAWPTHKGRARTRRRHRCRKTRQRLAARRQETEK